jgi:ketosteroid isomerase-like protein
LLFAPSPRTIVLRSVRRSQPPARPGYPAHINTELARSTAETVDRFNAAFNRHDVDAIMALMTDDCVFENTAPPPDGERFEGQVAVRRCWQDLFVSTPDARFTAEEIFVADDRAVVRWTYRWAPDSPTRPGHVRGVDVIRVRDGKVAEKLSYVKG